MIQILAAIYAIIGLISFKSFDDALGEHDMSVAAYMILATVHLIGWPFILLYILFLNVYTR